VPFLEASEVEFEARAQEWQASSTVPVYLTRVEQAIREEEERCVSFLNASSRPKLRARLIKVLVQVRMPWCVDEAGTGLPDLLRQADKLEDIATMHRLAVEVESGIGSAAMGQAVHEYAKREGHRYIEDRRMAIQGGGAD